VYHVSRLVQFETVINNESSSMALLNFIEIQNNLRVVRLALFNSNEEFVKKLMFHVLKNCPMLREFHYSCESNLILSLEELTKFLTLISKLLRLSLKFIVLISPFCETLPSLALTTLRLEAKKYSEVNEDFCITLLKHSSRLRSLKMTNFTSNHVLQNIFKYSVGSQSYIVTRTIMMPKIRYSFFIFSQINLGSLVLKFLGSSTDHGFIGGDDGFSVKRLQGECSIKYNYKNSMNTNDDFLCCRIETLGIDQLL